MADGALRAGHWTGLWAGRLAAWALGAGACAGALGVGLSVLGPAPVEAQTRAKAKGPPAAALPRFEPGPCPADVSFVPRKTECGVLVVAENRTRRSGRTVSLPVVIVRAEAGPQAKADPVVFLHGGPGGSVVDRLRAFFVDPPRPAGAPPLPAMVQADRDWIFFDQRGAGLSVPNLDCGEVQLTDSGLVSDRDVEMTTACHQRLAAAGIDLSQYNSQEIARDVADLRRALGFDRYNLFGISYGSRIAFAVMQYAPEGVRAVIHDSPYPPEAKGTEALPRLVSREVRKVLAKCEADAACKGRFGGLEARLDAAASEWARSPRVVAGRTYTLEDLGSWLLDATYSWSGTRSLPRDIDAVLSGRMGALDAYMADRSSYDEGQNLTHFCKEELPFESEAAMRASAQGDPLAQAVVATAARYFAACRAWRVGPANPREIEPVRSVIPTLMIASEIDAGCPADFVHSSLANLPRGQVVVVPNMTHGATRRSACARGMLHAFLADPARPVDTGCLATEHPSLPFILDEPTRP